MKRFLRWITGVLICLATIYQLNDMFVNKHGWFYSILFFLIYVISGFIGFNLIYKSLTDD